MCEVVGYEAMTFISAKKKLHTVLLYCFLLAPELEMPDSPLSPSAVRQTPASSLLSHTDTLAGVRVANGDSSSGVSRENWQNLHHKQVSSS